MNLGPLQLLNASRKVMTVGVADLDGCWQITSAALARQAIESAAGLWLQAHGVVVERMAMNTQFTIIRSIHDDPDLAAELAQTWSGLSHVCHATTYDMPPTSDELTRWQTTIH